MISKLPLEYVPLSHSNLEEGLEFGPVEFSVKRSSHNKSTKLLEESDINQQTEITTPYLFPSEMWGWARVFSHYFGRLNEVAVSRAKWEIKGRAFPEERLTSKSKVVGIQTRISLPFALTETTTRNDEGDSLIICTDELLLLHDVSSRYYEERAKEQPQPTNLSYERSRRVYFRYNWNDGTWLNNIHTDDYAQKFGYERGLPEFIMYMDWVFLTQLERLGEEAYNGAIMGINKILPIYENEIIKVLLTEQDQRKQKIQFFRGNQSRLEGLILR